MAPLRPAVPFPAALTPTTDVHDALGKIAWVRWVLAVAAAIATFAAVVAADSDALVCAGFAVEAVVSWAGFWYVGRVADTVWRAYGQLVALQAELHATRAGLHGDGG